MKPNSLSTVFVIAVILLSSNASMWGRTFKTVEGVAINASLEGVKTAGTKEMVILKIDKSARIYEIPLARLSIPDQKFVRSSIASGQSRAKIAAPSQRDALPKPSGSAIFSGLSSKLVAVEGGVVKRYKMEKIPDYYAFYFAAAWCPSCSRFTPQLARYYKNNISFANPNLEIIFVSRDGSKKEMEDYMMKSGMPWPAIKYSAASRKQLRRRYAPSGTPSLVLVDRAGKVISESFVDGKPRGAFAVKQDIAFWFTGGERTANSMMKSGLTSDKRVSD